MIPKEAEIVIMGGGVIGSCTAYFFQSRQESGFLIEKGGVGGEASCGKRRLCVDVDEASRDRSSHLLWPASIFISS